MLARLIR